MRTPGRGLSHGRWLLGLSLLLAPLACAGRATPSEVASEQQTRSVLLPSSFGWVSSIQPSGALPSAIALGGKASGRVLIYLEFPAPSESRRLLFAHLLLDTAGPGGAALDVELSRAEAPRGQLSSWSDQPRARYPRLSARIDGGASPRRVDVTELVRAEGKAGEPLRLLLRAEPGAPEPLLLMTGAAGGAAPRLETYWE